MRCTWGRKTGEHICQWRETWAVDRNSHPQKGMDRQGSGNRGICNNFNSHQMPSVIWAMSNCTLRRIKKGKPRLAIVRSLEWTPHTLSNEQGITSLCLTPGTRLVSFFLFARLLQPRKMPEKNMPLPVYCTELLCAKVLCQQGTWCQLPIEGLDLAYRRIGSCLRSAFPALGCRPEHWGWNNPWTVFSRTVP